MTAIEESNSKAQHVLASWKQKIVDHLLVVQGVLFVLTVVLSAMVFFPLGTITEDFNSQCLLFSEIYLKRQVNSTVTEDLAKTVFGPEDDCDLTTYLNVAVGIIEVMFLWFLIHYKHTKGRERSEVKFQAPNFVFHFALFIAVFVSSVKISKGLNYWCDHIYLSNNKQTEFKRITCDEFANLKWNSAHNFSNRARFHSYSQLAEVASWLLCVSIFVQCLATCGRLYKNYVQAVKRETASEKEDKEIAMARDSMASGGGIANPAAEYSESTFLKPGAERELDTYNVTIHEEAEENQAMDSSKATSLSPGNDVTGKGVAKQRKRKPKSGREQKPILESDDDDDVQMETRRRKDRKKRDKNKTDIILPGSEGRDSDGHLEANSHRQNSDLQNSVNDDEVAGCTNGDIPATVSESDNSSHTQGIRPHLPETKTEEDEIVTLSS